MRPRILATMGVLTGLLALIGCAPEALEAFKTAIAKEGGDDPRIQLHYAEAAWEAGDAAAARRSLENVDKNLEPLSIAERERLGRLRQAVEPKTK